MVSNDLKLHDNSNEKNCWIVQTHEESLVQLV